MEKKVEDRRIKVVWRLTKILLQIVALWPVIENSSNIKNILNSFHYHTIIFNTIYQICAMFSMCYVNYTDFTSTAESLGPMMALCVSLGKMLIYRGQKYRMVTLARSVEDCLENKDHSEVFNYFKSYAEVISLACGSLHFISLFLTVGYLGFPIFIGERIVPFVVYYPWDWSNSTFLYVVTYSHESILTIFLSCTIAIEYSFVWYICFSIARLKLLQNKLDDFANNSTDRSDEKSIDYFISSIVHAHTNVLNDIEQINSAYTNIIMLLFLAAVIAICCAGLQITNASTSGLSSQTILFLFLAIYFAEQLLFYYLPGDILADQIEDIGFSTYNCGWEVFSLKQRKSIRFIIMRSYLPLKLFVGNLIPLKLENYGSFLTTTASYFTSIKTVAD